MSRVLTSAERLCKAMTQHHEGVSKLVFQSAADNVKCTQGMVTNLLERSHDIHIDPDETYMIGLDDVTT